MALPSGQAKAKEIKQLLGTLESGSSSKESQQRLERLKVLGRDPTNADDIFSSRGIKILLRYGLDEGRNVAADEALSCLANCMLLKPATRQVAVTFGAAQKVADRYQLTEVIINEFLCARLLLFMTHNTSCDIDDLVETHELGHSIDKWLDRHATEWSKLGQATTAIPTPDMALSETLKLLFAINKKSTHKEAEFPNAVRPLSTILVSAKQNDASNQMLLHVVDALHVLSMDKSDQHEWFEKGHSRDFLERLVTLIDRSITSSKPDELDLKLSSGLALLLTWYAKGPADGRSLMKERLLPKEEERSKPLGQSGTLPARLLRLSTSAHTPQLRELVPELFFELSDRNAETFVNNVGYGYASGYLQNRKIPFNVPTGQGQAGQGSMRSDVNPVTGQFFSAEPKEEGPEMTDEEKEREAERLFVLFERLKKTGVVDVMNPVEEAVQSGRFEELPDD